MVLTWAWLCSLLTFEMDSEVDSSRAAVVNDKNRAESVTLS